MKLVVLAGKPTRISGESVAIPSEASRESARRPAGITLG
jgi:hypothetical protein